MGGSQKPKLNRIQYLESGIHSVESNRARRIAAWSWQFFLSLKNNPGSHNGFCLCNLEALGEITQEKNSACIFS